VLDLALQLLSTLCDAGAEALLRQLLAALLAAANEATTAAAAGRGPTRHPLSQLRAATKACQGTLAEAARAAADGAAAAVWDTAVSDILASSLGRFAVQGLVAVLLQHPMQLTVLLVSAAQAAASGSLPQEVLSRLQYPQGPVVLDVAAAIAQVSQEAGGSSSTPALQLAGQLLQVAAQLLLDGPVVQRHTHHPQQHPSQQPQQQHLSQQSQQQQQVAAVTSPELSAARDCLCCSYMALQPHWQLLGLRANPPTGQELLLGLRLLQPAAHKQAHLTRAAAGLSAAAGDAAKSASAAALIILLLLDTHEPPPAAAAAAHASSGGDSTVDTGLLHAQAIMQAVSSLVRVAFVSGPAAAAAEAAAAAFTGLWLLPEQLAQHAASLRHQEVFAALAAAAAVDFSALAAHISTSGGSSSSISALQLRQQLLQHILGSAASGRLYAAGHKGAGAPTAAGAAAGHVGLAAIQQALQEGKGHVGAVQRLLQQQHQQQQQQGPAVASVRQSFTTLLQNLRRSSPGPGQQPQQQQQAAGGSASAANASAALEVCLAQVNWAAFEASLGACEHACLHVLEALATVQQQQQQQQRSSSQLVALLEGCFLGVLASAGGTGAGPAAQQPPSQQQERYALLQVLAAAMQHGQLPDDCASSSSASGSLPPLQSPAAVHEDPVLREVLTAPSLLLPHGLLGTGLLRVLQALPVSEVGGWVGFGVKGQSCRVPLLCVCLTFSLRVCSHMCTHLSRQYVCCLPCAVGTSRKLCTHLP
jgi:hypothetical protein